MHTSRSDVGCKGCRLLFFSAIALIMVVIFSSVGLAQGGTKIPDIKPLPSDKPPKPSPKPSPKPPTPQKPPVTSTSDTAAAAPGGTYFSDNFSGSQLGPDWRMINPDPNRWTMQPKQKSLLIQTQTGLLSDSKNLKNHLILNRELPADDFEVIVEASIQIQAIGNAVSVALFGDDQNYFQVGFEGVPYVGVYRTAFFAKMFQGKATRLPGNQRSGPAAQPERIFLKFEREGNQYSGFYAYQDQPGAIDQIQWMKLGTLPWINFRPKLVLFAANSQEAPEVAAEFYSVVIRKK